MPLETTGRWTGANPFPISNPTITDQNLANPIVDSRGLFVLHAILVHTGKVLCFGGHVENMMYAALCYSFDPKNPTALLPAITFLGTDPFCGHFVQLPDGKVLAVGGSQHDVFRPASCVPPNPPGPAPRVYRGSTGSKTIAIFDPDALSGGVVTGEWKWSKTGAAINELRQGRWYPTAVTLPDGRVAIFSGRREIDDCGAPAPGVSAPFIADEVEILSPPDWSSTSLMDASNTSNPLKKDLPIYPGLHLAPNGHIYFSHTNWGQEIPNPDTASLLITNGATSASWTVYAGKAPFHPRREEGASVLLPPAQDGQILVIGGSKAVNSAGLGVFEAGAGGAAAFHHIEDPADPTAADILDTKTNAWLPGIGPMNFGRVNGHCVLLPDATVSICGGHDNYKWIDIAKLRRPAVLTGTQPSLFAEIFTPGPGGGFSTVPLAERTLPGRKMQDPRMYHSIALLLPDGRVMTAGGADPNQDEPQPDPTLPGDPGASPPIPVGFPAGWVGRTYPPGQVRNSKTFEFYEPPYLFKGWPAFSIADITDLPSVAAKLKTPTDGVSTYINTRLSTATQQGLTAYSGSGAVPGPLQDALVQDLNDIVFGLVSIHIPARFAGVTLRPVTQQLLLQNPQSPALARLNRLLLEDAYPSAIATGTRPVIDEILRNGAPTRRVEYGQTFTVRTAQAASIAKVAFMRPGACTHHTDTEQRYVALAFTKGTGELTVTAINDPKLAPPGYYMLWIVDDHDSQGRPCVEAMFVQLVPGVGQPGGGTSCLVATATFGSPDHPSVIYLQNLRREIREGTALGNGFIRIVNRIYGWFSPWVAGRLSDQVRRRAALIFLVRPVIAIIAANDRLTRRLRRDAGRHAVLMTLFTLETFLGLAVLPVIAVAIVAKIAFTNWLERPNAPEKQEQTRA